jgi:Co/Zn/Cd efflux system component
MWRPMPPIVVYELRVLIPLGISLLTISALKIFLGVTFGGLFVTFFGFLLKSPRFQDKSTASIELGHVKVSWDGALTVGLIVAGLLMIILGVFAYLFTHQII